VLAAAGCSFDDVVDQTFYFVDPEVSVGLVIDAVRQAFPREPLPNMTAVGVNWRASFQFEA